ncbi:succinyldiaminopimelate transaminase [Candidatus Methylospira mobilis]|uniref:Succinyldiaminopimelate transaminase n=1 Tax=Candidatus Methylospira mobilis TaxID=1808979 RepID=A0A5Q0BPJ3_9GAMM|nr:succinyldiaminopimelate transaminase [Candidatus Methylospira mobilis]QFY44008.1 succinyldiaminopimelate transaminase [Candidatus Methylospira mobilis]WNV05012.1 succinyldiaminopimelate transaminase [Candidatus Methylospira mobilis]
MNPLLENLQSYPFEKLAALKEGLHPPAHKRHIALSIGEPQHPTPQLIRDALTAHMDQLNSYPTTRGTQDLRRRVAQWLQTRYRLPQQALDPESHILPVAGTREALFSFAQCLIDATRPALVLMPNPFYQIYEGAALLAGATPVYLNTTAGNQFIPSFDEIDDATWANCRLLYVCSPGNPTGAVMNAATHEKLINLADRYNFVIASDECYSELYRDENNPPPGLLQSAWDMGNSTFKNCVVFHSLSKRSNAPGLRSGFVAGDAAILKKYLLYRTYHGCALSLPVQAASVAAWSDEAHVKDNRALYNLKFDQVLAVLGSELALDTPDAGFYLWAKTPVPGVAFARGLFEKENITVLPGSYLSRQQSGMDPGRDYVRIALVAQPESCLEAAHRIKSFIHTL